MSTNRVSYDESRRVFRGRGGANDSKLPKYQARRRKGTRTAVKGTTKYDNDGNADNSAHVTLEEVVGKGSDEQKEEFPHLDIIETETQQASPAENEIKHLKRRLRNVQESIQLSGTAIADPVIWQANVLNAVQNSVKEWRAIVTHYPELDTNVPLTKETSLAVYMLIQLAMQSGPLAGGKPGYFKRCGSGTAGVSLNFLRSIVTDSEEAQLMCFSAKQADAIQKWKQNATKAIAEDKAPSKSVLKRHDNANKAKGNVQKR